MLRERIVLNRPKEAFISKPIPANYPKIPLITTKKIQPDEKATGLPKYRSLLALEDADENHSPFQKLAVTHAGPIIANFFTAGATDIFCHILCIGKLLRKKCF